MLSTVLHVAERAARYSEAFPGRLCMLSKTYNPFDFEEEAEDLLGCTKMEYLDSFTIYIRYQIKKHGIHSSIVQEQLDAFAAIGRPDNLQTGRNLRDVARCSRRREQIKTYAVASQDYNTRQYNNLCRPFRQREQALREGIRALEKKKHLGVGSLAMRDLHTSGASFLPVEDESQMQQVPLEDGPSGDGDDAEALAGAGLDAVEAEGEDEKSNATRQYVDDNRTRLQQEVEEVKSLPAKEIDRKLLELQKKSPHLWTIQDWVNWRVNTNEWRHLVRHAVSNRRTRCNMKYEGDEDEWKDNSETRLRPQPWRRYQWEKSFPEEPDVKWFESNRSRLHHKNAFYAVKIDSRIEMVFLLSHECWALRFNVDPSFGNVFFLELDKPLQPEPCRELLSNLQEEQTTLHVVEPVAHTLNDHRVVWKIPVGSHFEAQPKVVEQNEKKQKGKGKAKGKKEKDQVADGLHAAEYDPECEWQWDEDEVADDIEDESAPHQRALSLPVLADPALFPPEEENEMELAEIEAHRDPPLDEEREPAANEDVQGREEAEMENQHQHAAPAVADGGGGGLADWNDVDGVSNASRKERGESVRVSLGCFTINQTDDGKGAANTCMRIYCLESWKRRMNEADLSIIWQTQAKLSECDKEETVETYLRGWMVHNMSKASIFMDTPHRRLHVERQKQRVTLEWRAMTDLERAEIRRICATRKPRHRWVWPFHDDDEENP
ncbi:unnamed protein product [Amoebophrya sp. A25]|nr:unnamed protein product [Amoebophrya sp. A25]|eukprot:GSA25T00019910001.1